MAAWVCVINVSPGRKTFISRETFIINTFLVHRGIYVLDVRGLDKRRSLTGHGRRDTFITLDVVSFMTGTRICHKLSKFQSSRKNSRYLAYGKYGFPGRFKGTNTDNYETHAYDW